MEEKSLDRKLLDVVAEGDLAGVKALLSEGADSLSQVMAPRFKIKKSCNI